MDRSRLAGLLSHAVADQASSNPSRPAHAAFDDLVHECFGVFGRPSSVRGAELEQGEGLAIMKMGPRLIEAVPAASDRMLGLVAGRAIVLAAGDRMRSSLSQKWADFLAEYGQGIAFWSPAAKAHAPLAWAVGQREFQHIRLNPPAVDLLRARSDYVVPRLMYATDDQSQDLGLMPAQPGDAGALPIKDAASWLPGYADIPLEHNGTTAVLWKLVLDHRVVPLSRDPRDDHLYWNRPDNDG